MDDSQSSDLLSESTDIFCNSPCVDPSIMDTVTYESLVLNTKSAFSTIRREIRKATFSDYFANLLKDCSVCITQSLDLITDLLSETNIKVNKLVEYMNDAVSLLQLLSDLIKNIIESISMSCCSMKTFPLVTGQIIMLVFTHCKDSEAVYGDQLSKVEKQIKDLFRTCHELQLTYLMVLEKHYIFDLTEKEQQDILIEALDINLKIGEIVQSLDVKTMAEQWKAYTVICEKYSNTLMDKRIYSDCTNILCAMVTNNLNTALEANQEEKVILRSLKVTSFTLKILLRVCITFKHAVIKDYDSVMDLLLFVNLYNEAYLHTIGGKCSQFINLYNSNVTGPVNSLLGELLYDDKLLQCICNYQVDKIKRDDKLLGLIVLVISTIRSLLQKGGDQLAKLQKHRLINIIYWFLPHCHVWFNMGLQFKCEAISSRSYETYGLYEYLLTHTVTLASMMISEELNILEKRMLEAILSTDCISAMFSSNLWVLLARMSSRQLLLSQVIPLSKIYQKLENNNSFEDSPQKVHLRHSIGRLFEVMANEDKLKIYNMFNINDDKNMGLWSCLKICNLPNEVQCGAEEIALEYFKTQIRKLTSNETIDIDDVIKSLHLASTCSHMNIDIEIESFLIQAWIKACPSNLEHIVKHLDKRTIWYYKYVEGLATLTESMEHIFQGNSVNLVKVLHIVANIVHMDCKELKLLIINILCKLANFETNDVNKHVSDAILTQTFRELFGSKDSIVRNKLFNIIRKHKSNNLLRIVNVVNKEETLGEVWTHYVRHGTIRNISCSEMKEQLVSTVDFDFRHKCMEQHDLRDSQPLSLQKSFSNNFDLVDIDTLFEPEVDAEPACKKAKLNNDDIDDIIARLESDTKLLCKIKENVFTSEYTKRIKAICNKLYNIID